MRPPSGFAVLLAAPRPVTADLARNLLAGEGIPSMLHGPGVDPASLVEWGLLRPAALPDLLVPESALDRARAVLAEAWGAIEPQPIDGDEAPGE